MCIRHYKRKKVKAAILLVAFLTLLVFPAINVPAYAAASAVKVVAGQAKDGLLPVEIVLEGLPAGAELMGFNLQLSYNPAVLKYKSLTKENFFPGWTWMPADVDDASGKLEVAAAKLNGNNPSDSSGKVLTVVFTAVGQGSSPLVIQKVALRDYENQDIHLTKLDGQAIVTQSGNQGTGNPNVPSDTNQGSSQTGPPAAGSVIPVTQPAPPAVSQAPINQTGIVDWSNLVTRDTSTGDQSHTTSLTINRTKAMDSLNKQGNGARVLVQETADADVIDLAIPSDLLKALADKKAYITLQTQTASYDLPFFSLNLTKIAEQLQAPESAITIRIVIEKAGKIQEESIQRPITQSGAVRVAPAINFRVEASAQGKSIELNNFNSYVTRTITLNRQVNPNGATGIVLRPDGTIQSVPTIFVTRDGKTLAQLKRKTNSTYTVIECSQNFSDLTNHWAKSDINTLASKLIVEGISPDTFAPNGKVSRALFAATIVKGLGLEPQPEHAKFSDIKPGDWHTGYIGAAVKAGVIKGYSDGTFRPEALVSRQEVAVMVVKALEYAGKTPSISEANSDGFLSRFKDQGKIGSWAKSFVASAVQEGIVVGDNLGNFAPLNTCTRAELVVMVKKMLSKAELL